MRASFQSWIFVAAAALVAGAGCSKLNMDQQPCPCATGWICCRNNNVCVKSRATCPGGGQPMPDALPFGGVSDAIVPIADAMPPTRVVIASGQAMPETLTVNGELSWLDVGDGSVMTMGLWPTPVRLIRAATTLATVTPGKAAMDALYVADDADGAIVQVGGTKPVTLATGQLHPRAIALGKQQHYVYWTTYGHGDTQADGTVARVPALEGGPVQVLASGLAGPGPMVVSDTYVYFATDGKTAGANEILRVPLAGGKPEVLATDQTHPNALSFDGSLEWTTSADASSTGRIMRMTFPGGQTEVMLDDAHNPTALHLPFFLNDDGISRFVYPQSPGGRVTTAVVVPLAPEPGRSLWGADPAGNGLVWTNPHEGTVEALLRNQ